VRRKGRVALGLLALVGAGVCAAAAALQHAGVAPRQLGPYLERRTSGHNPLIEKSGRWLASTLVALDRGDDGLAPDLPLLLGAQPGPLPQAAGDGEGRPVLVAGIEELRAPPPLAKPP
jgi:hypothetical protein